MSVLEVRRHSIRKTDGGSQLSQKGVNLARELGTSIGPFKRVVTSVLPRCRETAIAMGFAVDQELVTLAGYDTHAELQDFEWKNPNNPYREIVGLIARGNDYALYANSMAGLWRDILTPLSADDQALFIGHSGEIEAALVACFPIGSHENWGRRFRPLEGARIHFDGDPAHFSQVEILRFKHTQSGSRER